MRISFRGFLPSVMTRRLISLPHDAVPASVIIRIAGRRNDAAESEARAACISRALLASFAQPERVIRHRRRTDRDCARIRAITEPSSCGAARPLPGRSPTARTLCQGHRPPLSRSALPRSGLAPPTRAPEGPRYRPCRTIHSYQDASLVLSKATVTPGEIGRPHDWIVNGGHFGDCPGLRRRPPSGAACRIFSSTRARAMT